MDYLKENIEKVTEYAEYVAETVNTNLLMEADTDAGIDAEDLNGKTKDVSGKIEFDGKIVDQSAHDDSKELEKELDGEDEAGKEVVESIDRMDAYKSEISSKLSALLEKAAAKQVAEPHFFKFISEAKKEEFNTLSTEEKTLVVKSVSNKGFLTESQIYALWGNTLAGAQNVSGNEPYVVSAMPKEYKETWNKLSESKKNQLLAQSKYFRLETEYQVRNFWQTRDLRETTTVMEKVEIINEKAEVIEKKTMPYDMTGVAESLTKKFKK